MARPMSMATDTCTNCKAFNPDLKPCPCLTAFYCDRDCQVKHWPIHVKSCSIAAQRKASAQEQTPVDSSAAFSQHMIPPTQYTHNAPLRDLGFTQSSLDSILTDQMHYTQYQMLPESVQLNDASGAKAVSRIAQLAQGLPSNLLVATLCELAEDVPQIADLLRQRLEKATLLATQSDGSFGMMGGMLHHQQQAFVQAPIISQSMMHHGGFLQQNAMQDQQRGDKRREKRDRRPYNEAEQMECMVHYNMRSTKHLTFNGVGWECIPGFHCLESRAPTNTAEGSQPTAPPVTAPSQPMAPQDNAGRSPKHHDINVKSDIGAPRDPPENVEVKA